jgi:hypothetical protein
VIHSLIRLGRFRRQRKMAKTLLKGHPPGWATDLIVVRMAQADRRTARIIEGDEFEAAAHRCWTIRPGESIHEKFFRPGPGFPWERDAPWHPFKP